ncbi:type VI secretion system baseplate subunit TssF [Azohydromonas aeria]|uniref:type VI secretion system baseplate subunit TssF n=1 Tax=Azohydromonas aeria TaxID=2590212 RepID=UPI0012F99262|nr:type VI secretion system baseplate subunit TssF [Azohydromonas aeria]
MEELLALYEAEMRRLCSEAAAFAQDHEALARVLEITGEGHSEDPQVQRLMQGAALLSARAVQRIEDRYAGFTFPLLHELFPQALRPFPACAIAACGPDPQAPPPAQALALPRGTRLKAPAVRGVRCEFRSAFDVTLWPLRVAGMSFHAGSGAAAGAPLPQGTAALLSLRLQLTAGEATWPSPVQPPLRLFLGGEAAQAAVLREALCGAVLGVLVQADAGPWRAAAGSLPRAVGFAPAEALPDGGAFLHPAQRLLAEFFAFPSKFDFIDLPWPAELQGMAAREVTLHFALDASAASGAPARVLEGVRGHDLVPGCTPVVNLFERRVQPVPVAREVAQYTVAADADGPWAAELYAIERLHWAPPQSRPLREVLPLYSLRYGGRPAQDVLAWKPAKDGLDDGGGTAAALRIAVIDDAMQPVALDGGALSAEILATNGALPEALDAGALLEPEGAGATCHARLLQRPTPSRRFDLRGEAPWRLISHLSPNPLWLDGQGVEALRELLCLYDLSGCGAGARLAQGLLAIESRAVSAWLYLPEAYMARGTEVRLTVDAACFAPPGLQLFAQVLEHWLTQHVHRDSFIRLKLLCAHGAVLFGGEVRQGVKPLL